MTGFNDATTIHANSVSVNVDHDHAGGWPDVVWLDNGRLLLGFVPELGGRLLSVQVEGVETLWRNSLLLDERLHPVGHRAGPHDGQLGDWRNYGGDKTWPAPQGWSGPQEWAGPPDPVLDSGPFTYDLLVLDDGSARLSMVSAADPRTGLRLSRTYVLNSQSNSYDVLLEATNTSDQDVCWAIWNVTQRPADLAGGGVVVSVTDFDESDGEHTPLVIPLVTGTGVPDWRPLDRRRVLIPHQQVVGKVGFPHADGLVEHTSKGTVSSIRFVVEPDAPYPDEGSRVEVWIETPLEHPLAHLGGLRPTEDIVELEVLGPLRTLAPGQSTTLSLLCRSSTVSEKP